MLPLQKDKSGIQVFRAAILVFPPLSGRYLPMVKHRMSQESSKNKYCDETCHDRYIVSMFHRALAERDVCAWECVQQALRETMLGWLRSYPTTITACINSEDAFVVQAFARLWTITEHQPLEDSSAVFKYLQASLRAVLIDAERASQSTPLVNGGASNDRRRSWKAMCSLCINEREQRLAYLLYHCALTPLDIVRLCPREFSDVQEVKHLRQVILQRCLRDTDAMRQVFENDQSMLAGKDTLSY